MKTAFMLLADVAEVRGEPVVVFGRVRLPAKTRMECLEVVRVDPNIAASLRGLLARARAGDGDERPGATGGPGNGL